MTHSGRWSAAALAFAFATVAVGGAEAAPGRKGKPQQIIPTGAEDAPAAGAGARARAAAPVDTGDALIERITSKDSRGLYQESLSDGSVTVNLDDRFQHVMRVTQNDDGTLSAACNDDHATAPKKAAKSLKKGKAAKAAPAPVSKAPALEEM